MPLFTAIGHFIDAINLFCLQQLVDLVNLQATWPWLLIGFLPPLLFLPATRLAVVCPQERSWALLPLRWFGKGLMLAVALAVGAALIITQFAHDHALEIYRRQLAQADAEAMVAKLWSYVAGQLHLVGWGALAGLALGVAALIAIVTYLEPYLVQLLRRWTRSVTEDTQTDARTVQDRLPQSREFDATKFFPKAREQDAVFFGVNRDNRPVYIPRPVFKTTNVQVMGPQGSGKGVQAAIVLAQGIALGDFVLVLDPKPEGDEYGRHVFAHACVTAGKPFTLVDLNAGPQINPLLRISRDHAEELLIASLGVGETGDQDDVYRDEDRKAVRKLAALVEQGPQCFASLADAVRTVLDEAEQKAARKAINGLEEIASRPSVQTLAGVDLEQRMAKGGCVYVIGAMRNTAVVRAQRALLLRTLQLVERRKREGAPHVSIFADEIKYHLSLPCVNALGTIRDKGANLVFTHQTLGDFGFGGKQLDGDSVRDTVIGTSGLKWFYQTKDEPTAKWIAGMTGTKLVDRDRRTAEPNEAGVESLRDRRTVEKVPDYLVSVNEVQHLPKGCAVLINPVSTAELAFASPLKGPRYTFKLAQAPLYERRQSAGDFLKGPLVTPEDGDMGSNGGGAAGGALL